MAIIDWNDTISEIVVELPMVEPDLCEVTLVRVARDLFAATRDYIKRLDAINVVAGVAEYELSSGDANFDVLEPVRVLYDGRLLSPTTHQTLDANYPYDWQSYSSTPNHYLVEPLAGKLRLFPTPDEDLAGGLLVDATLVPSSSCRGIDESLLAKYQPALVAGTLAALYGMHDKAWSSTTKASLKSKEYTFRLNTAVHRARLGHTRQGLRVVPRKFL